MGNLEARTPCVTEWCYSKIPCTWCTIALLTLVYISRCSIYNLHYLPMSCMFFYRGKTPHKWREESIILLHRGLNLAWHLWLSTRFSRCLKMKLVEICLGYIQGQFYRFSRGCKPQENFWNCSIKYPKMFITDFIFRKQNIEFKPECQAWACYNISPVHLDLENDLIQSL